MTDDSARTVGRFMLVLVGKMATDGITGESGRRIEEALTTEGTDLHRRMRREERFAEDKSRKKMEDISHRCTQIDTEQKLRQLPLPLFCICLLSVFISVYPWPIPS